MQISISFKSRKSSLNLLFKLKKLQVAIEKNPTNGDHDPGLKYAKVKNSLLTQREFSTLDNYLLYSPNQIWDKNLLVISITFKIK